jgi:hypothetical protein
MSGKRGPALDCLFLSRLLLAGALEGNAASRQQAVETDSKKREAVARQIQRLVYERARYGPIFDYIWPSGVGPREVTAS